MKKMRPCPFCGHHVKIQITDSEGNLRPPEYVDNPWSGLAYHITHDYHELEEGVVCPIATHEDEFIGALDYDSIDELIEVWNKRV